MDEDCGFQGNGDLYGLGVRLGLYIQLVTVALVSSFLPRSPYLGFFKNTNLSLFASTWIIILKESILRDIRGVEINIFNLLTVLQLAVLGLLAMRGRISIGPKFLLGTICVQLVTVSYWLWFFWRGLDVLPRSTCPDEYAFIFAKVSLYHWFRTLSKALFTILGVSIVLGEYNCSNVKPAKPAVF